jgi:hypothetical protein
LRFEVGADFLTELATALRALDELQRNPADSMFDVQNALTIG